jgi:hypothetical protein
MAGTFTKLGLGIGFFTLILVFGVGFLVQMGNEYGVTLETQFQNTLNYQDEFTGITADASGNIEGGGIDAQATDIAQVQGATSAGRQQLKYFSIIRECLGDLINIIPYDAKFNIILFSIIGVMLISAFIYLFIGRDP